MTTTYDVTDLLYRGRPCFQARPFDIFSDELLFTMHDQPNAGAGPPLVDVNQREVRSSDQWSTAGPGGRLHIVNNMICRLAVHEVREHLTWPDGVRPWQAELDEDHGGIR